MNTYSVVNEINKIKSGLKQQSSCASDEVKVMQNMLNDSSYQVNVYDKSGVIGQYNPRQSAVDVAANVIKTCTGVSKEESASMASQMEFTKQDAQNQVNLSKAFVNTYLETGRKLPLGATATSDVALVQKSVDAGTVLYPVKVGVDDNGKGIYKTETKEMPGYSTVKAIGGCPDHLKK